jgi:membrane protein
MVLPGRGMSFKEFFSDLKREFERDKLLDTAGALAFFGVLALFPFLLFLVSLAAMFIDPARANALMEQLYRLMPDAVARILSERLQSLLEGNSPALLTVGGVGAVWAASGGVAALMDAFNAVYNVEDSRSFWKRRGVAILVTLGGAAFLIVASMIAFVTPAIAHFFPEPIATLILWLRMPVAALIMMMVLAVLYYVLPDVEQEFKFITPGSVVAVVLWMIASLGFSLYAKYFGSYEATYGALGGVAVFLFWMWLSSIAILLGAEINAIIEHRSAEGKKVGAKSMDDRGPDVPKTEKAEQDQASLEAAVVGDAPPLAPAPALAVKDEIAIEPAPAASSTFGPGGPQAALRPEPSPPRRAGVRPLDAVLGAGAVALGYLLGKRLTK